MLVGWGFSLFGNRMAPPTVVCYSCKEQEACHGSVLLITLSGTIPIKKVKQVCNINYSITKFGNTQKGYEYYPSLGPPEASDVAYIG